MMKPEEIQAALQVAARALEIANYQNVKNVQVHPPKEWLLPVERVTAPHPTEDDEEIQVQHEETAVNGYCSTHELAQLIHRVAKGAADSTAQMQADALQLAHDLGEAQAKVKELQEELAQAQTEQK